MALAIKQYGEASMSSADWWRVMTEQDVMTAHLVVASILCPPCQANCHLSSLLMLPQGHVEQHQVGAGFGGTISR